MSVRNNLSEEEVTDERKLKAIIVTGPSGSGKGRVAKKILETFDSFCLSIPATTREPGPGEEHGKDYYFISREEFKKKIDEGAFVEYEEVYQGNFYGTLFEEMEHIVSRGRMPLFEIDVAGALRIRKILGENALVIFLHPGEPVIEVLRGRLRNRKRDSEEKIEKRLKKALDEIAMGRGSDYIVVNENGKFKETITSVFGIVMSFLKK